VAVLLSTKAAFQLARYRNNNMPILPLYAALLAVLFVVLSIRVIRLRQGLRVGLGDAGNSQLQRAIRVHANFAEYVPLGLLLIFLVEGQGASTLLVNVLGMGLLLGRLCHAFGVSQASENLRFRVCGMVITFLTLLTSAAYLLFTYL
jgi:uncharacterized membrane protein YecN with MAPEG domain